VDIAGAQVDEIAYPASARFAIENKFDLAFHNQESFAVPLMVHRRTRARRTETLGDRKRPVGVAGARPESEKISEKVNGVGRRFVVGFAMLHFLAFLFNDTEVL
tara:strand:+ start:50 stop:361 length:312 start_codon:yes stop_codon:yes gene_type:complete